jgi:hypothetical protein
LKKPFNYFVGIDWSGDKKRWQRGLKIACARPGSSAPELVSGQGVNGRWSRTEAVRWIGELVEKERALIGLDFAFGFPVSEFSLNWEYVEKLCSADSNFYGGQFFRAASARHAHLINSRWLSGRAYSSANLRATERAARLTTGATPQSIFNAVGAAQVGPSSTSGMRVLLHLRQTHGDKISIWPFDHLDDDRSLIVEIFPRYFPLSRGLSPKLSDHVLLNAALKEFGSQPVETAPKSEDEGDALLSAAALRSLSADYNLFKVASEYVATEGWIFGIPYNHSSFDEVLTSEQIVEIERRLASDDAIATDDEVNALFDRFRASRIDR